jgi:hypothetical protein
MAKTTAMASTNFATGDGRGIAQSTYVVQVRTLVFVARRLEGDKRRFERR